MVGQPDPVPSAHTSAKPRLSWRLAVWAAIVVVGLWLAWSLGSGIAPGVYVGDLEASQVVVQRLIGPSIPVLWVPRWPWDSSPAFGEVCLCLDDGTVLTLGTARPTFRGSGPSRTGYLTTFFTATEALSDGEGAVQNKVSHIRVSTNLGEVECSPTSLYAVKPRAPISDGGPITPHMSVTFSIDNETFVIYLHVEDDADIEVTDIILPPEAYPLAVRRTGQAETALELPLRLENGLTEIWTNITGGVHDGSVLLMPLLEIRLRDETYLFCPFGASFHFSGSELRTIYRVDS